MTLPQQPLDFTHTPRDALGNRARRLLKDAFFFSPLTVKPSLSSEQGALHTCDTKPGNRGSPPPDSQLLSDLGQMAPFLRALLLCKTLGKKKKKHRERVFLIWVSAP